MDMQEHGLRARTAGTDVGVVRRGDDLILTLASDARFSSDSDRIEPALRLTLDQIASVLGANDSTFVDIYGHSDSTGGDAFNQRLSERRAAAVGAYLSAHGVRSARIATHGFGKTQPIATDDGEAGRAMNRRVEIKIVPIADTDLR